MSPRERQDLPSSRGTPIARLPCSVDAGRTAGTRPLRCRSVAPGMGKAEAPTKGLSTLNSRAFGLAVYASPGRLPRPDARLASSRWSDATGRAFHPQGSYERFPRCNRYIPSSFPKLCLAQSHRHARASRSALRAETDTPTRHQGLPLARCRLDQLECCRTLSSRCASAALREGFLCSRRALVSSLVPCRQQAQQLGGGLFGGQL